MVAFCRKEWIYYVLTVYARYFVYEMIAAKIGYAAVKRTCANIKISGQSFGLLGVKCDLSAFLGTVRCVAVPRISGKNKK